LGIAHRAGNDDGAIKVGYPGKVIDETARTNAIEQPTCEAEKVHPLQFAPLVSTANDGTLVVVGTAPEQKANAAASCFSRRHVFQRLPVRYNCLHSVDQRPWHRAASLPETARSSDDFRALREP